MENTPSSSSPASLRWAILRRSLLSRSPPQPECDSEISTTSISRKIAGGFNLIPRLLDTSSEVNDLGRKRDAHVCYNLPVEGGMKLTLIQRMDDSIDINDFENSAEQNIDTTGLICCWPSEEVLAYFCLIHLDMFRSKRVLELGSGYGLAGFAIAAATAASEVVISDGNERVVNYIQRSISLNAGVFGDTKVRSMTLHWEKDQNWNILNTFDIIVASDCTFFKEFHESLALTVRSLLKNSDTSEALFFSPRRGNSLDMFLEKIKHVGLRSKLIENYDNKVWNLHQKFLNGDNTSWINYENDHCYPILVRVCF